MTQTRLDCRTVLAVGTLGITPPTRIWRLNDDGTAVPLDEIRANASSADMPESLSPRSPA